MPRKVVVVSYALWWTVLGVDDNASTHVLRRFHKEAEVKTWLDENGYKRASQVPSSTLYERSA